jgi:hypothetical protein
MVEIKRKILMDSRGAPLMEIKKAGSKVSNRDNSKVHYSKVHSREVNRPGRFNKHIFMMGDLVEW